MELTNIPIWNVFILFLIIASNYIGELFPCRVQNLLSSNIYLKHFIAFLTLMFFVVLTDSSSQQKEFKLIFTDSLKLYVLWLFLINNDKKFFVIALILLGIIYIIQLIKNDFKEKINKKKNIEYNEEILKYTLNIEKIIYYIFFIVLIIGFIIYMGEKKIEYKNKFSYFTFIFGKPSCKGKSPDVKYIEAFSSAFK